MKIYNLLSIFLLLCLSAKAQEEPITETETLSALQEALPTLNKYKLITDGNEWFLAEQEAVSAINEHNRTTTGVQRKIISNFSYKRNHHLILGLPPDPYKVYGDKWFDMTESIADTFLKDVGPLRPSSNQQFTDRSNKVFRDGRVRFLTTQEAVSAINNHNKTALAQNKIISNASYEKNYRLIPGLPRSLKHGDYWYYPNKKKITSQVIGWKGDFTGIVPGRNRGNKVFRGNSWRFLTEQEAISAINEHNKTALAKNKIISNTSYEKNYGLIPGLPSHMHYRYDPNSLRSQIIGWKNPTRGNKVFKDGIWRFLTEQEAISAINEHNRTTTSTQNKIISTTSYRDNYGLIPGLPSRYEFINNNRITSQIIGWEGYSTPGRRGNKVFRDGVWRFLTEQEAISAINEYNKTAPLQNQITSEHSYRQNYRWIHGLPHFDTFKTKGLLDRITSQITSWHGRGLRVAGFLTDEHVRSLTEQEAISAINEHNRTTTVVQNKIISPMSYQENYGLIPGLPPNPWTHYGLTTWKVMLKKIHFDHYNNNYGICSAQFTIP